MRCIFSVGKIIDIPCRDRTGLRNTMSSGKVKTAHHVCKYLVIVGLCGIPRDMHGRKTPPIGKQRWCQHIIRLGVRHK